jgi:mono/diheme cytochrome c family protein
VLDLPALPGPPAWGPALLTAALLLWVSAPAAAQTSPDGAALYVSSCSACHGPSGAPEPRVVDTLPVAPANLGDCAFASREPDADWHTIVRDGGPARAFDPFMPAFGDALDAAQIEAILHHVRTFCRDRRWPRGELNLPRPLFTEKAYPEDETVVSTDVAVEGQGAVTTKVIYERRIGAQAQWEVVVPIASHASGTGAWTGGIGDVAIGVKRALGHSLRRGTIVSLTGEIVLPTGSEDRGLGRGVAVFEPFVTLGQLLPRDGFLQVQAGMEVPFDGDADNEAFWRAAAGRSFSRQAGAGRTWSPMLEVLGARELATGARVEWDLVPQVQVTLSRRQHIMLNVGVRVPVTDTGARHTRVVMYLLWDWFDGGFFEGW